MQYLASCSSSRHNSIEYAFHSSYEGVRGQPNEAVGPPTSEDPFHTSKAMPFSVAALRHCSSAETKHSDLLSRAALSQMASPNLPTVLTVNVYTTERTRVVPEVSKRRGHRQTVAIFLTEQKKSKIGPFRFLKLAISCFLQQLAA